MHLVPRQAYPSRQRFIAWKRLEHRLVGAINVLWIAGQRYPAERAASLTEERPDVLRYESGNTEGIRHAGFASMSAYIVAVIKRDSAPVLELPHCTNMDSHRCNRPADVDIGLLGSERVEIFTGII